MARLVPIAIKKIIYDISDCSTNTLIPESEIVENIFTMIGDSFTNR